MTDQRMQQDTLCYQWFKHTQATHVPQTTSKAVAAIFSGMPSWSSGAGTLFAACDKAFSNLGDIFLVLLAMSFLDLLTQRILICECEKKFRDWF